MEQSTTTPVAETGKRKSLWGWAIFGVYTTFALATIGFVVFAFSQKVELVTNNYYAEAVDFESQIQRERNSSAVEGKVTCTRSEDGKNIVLQFPSAQVNGNILLYRPSQSAMDKELTVAADAKGLQYIPVEQLNKGMWKLKLNWKAEDKEYYNEYKLEI